MYCLECNSPLSKRQKKFCSYKCMNVYNAREFGMKNREEKPNRYKVCDNCEQSLNLSKFSLIEKWNINSDTKNTCKKCSIKIKQSFFLKPATFLGFYIFRLSLTFVFKLIWR